MDPDFLRELLVLLAFIGLYIFAAALLLRKHKTDLSAVVHGTTGGAVGAVAPRLSRRRKAVARDAAERASRRGPDTDAGPNE